MDRAAIRTKTRQLLGATDASKGGPADTDFAQPINDAVNRFATKSRGLSSVFKLSTVANDKYLPLESQILWPKTVSFVDTDGRRWPLDLVEVAPAPGILGSRPNVWWLTAVNVPDVTGPSTRTIGLDPYVNYNGSGNVILEVIQLPQALANDGDILEIHEAFHHCIAYGAALELVSLFPEKLSMVSYWEQRWREYVEMFQILGRPGAEQPKTFKDAMGYRARSTARM